MDWPRGTDIFTISSPRFHLPCFCSSSLDSKNNKIQHLWVTSVSASTSSLMIGASDPPPTSPFCCSISFITLAPHCSLFGVSHQCPCESLQQNKSKSTVVRIHAFIQVVALLINSLLFGLISPCSSWWKNSLCC